GATLDRQSGAFDWTPGVGQQGDYSVILSVSDGEAVTRRTALIRVARTPQAPRVHIELTPGFPAIPGQKVVVHVVASSLAEIVQLQLHVDGSDVALDGDGKATLIAGAPGRLHIEAMATDADGFIGRADATLKIRDVNNHSAPAVALDPSINRTPLTVATTIQG